MDKDTYGQEMLNTINNLIESGVKNLSVIMRHSARHYSPKIEKEPFMGLTDEGKELSRKLGCLLPKDFHLRFFSSHIGRCIETAYLIEKGFIQKGGETESNILEECLSPFYVNDLKKTIKAAFSNDLAVFIRRWFDGKLSPDALLNPKDSAGRILGLLAEKLNDNSKNIINVSITHDWNIYLLKEFCLGLDHETYGEVEYLDGVIVYKNNGNIKVTCPQGKSKTIKEIMN